MLFLYCKWYKELGPQIRGPNRKAGTGMDAFSIECFFPMQPGFSILIMVYILVPGTFMKA